MVFRKGFFICVLVLLTMAACREHSGQTIVAFYNCENFFDTIHDPHKLDEEFTPEGRYHYTGAIYNEKLHNIAAVIQKMVTDEAPQGPAVLGLAEVENDMVLQALIAQPAIARRHYKYVWYNGPDRRGINVALLYNPALFTLISSAPLAVHVGDTGSSHTTRDVLHVYGVLNGDSVHLLVNHWPSRIGGNDETEPKRAAAALVCKQAVTMLLKQNSKVIVMGDLNENPADSSIDHVLTAKYDSAATSATDIYDPWAEVYTKGAGTLMYQHQWYLFDQIMISGGFLHGRRGLQLDKIEVFTPELITDHRNIYEKVPKRSFAGTYWMHGYSDHFPVLIYLKNNMR